MMAYINKIIIKYSIILMIMRRIDNIVYDQIFNCDYGYQFCCQPGLLYYFMNEICTECYQKIYYLLILINIQSIYYSFYIYDLFIPIYFPYSSYLLFQLPYQFYTIYIHDVIIIIYYDKNNFNHLPLCPLSNLSFVTSNIITNLNHRYVLVNIPTI